MSWKTYIAPSTFRGPYALGQVATNAAGQSFTVVGASPENDLYDYVPPASTECDPDRTRNTYYIGTESNAFSGAVNTATGLVTGTWVCTPVTLAELYDIKRGDISVQDEMVRYNAVFTSLDPDWWLVVTREQTDELLLIYAGALRRELRGLNWPTGASRPWVGIYNQLTQDARRYRISQAGADPKRSTTWDTLMDEWGDHTQQTGNATDASRSALDAAYGDGTGAPGGPEWQAVADHDPADPAWGYPPTVDSTALQAATA